MATARAKKRETHGSSWGKPEVTRLKDKVKRELDDAFAKGGSIGRRRYIQKHIAGLADDSAPLVQLERYVYVMSALMHQERYGGFTRQQIRQLAAIAGGIREIPGRAFGPGDDEKGSKDNTSGAGRHGHCVE